MKEKAFNLLFIPFGLPILCMDVIADMFYFWKNNFRSDLVKNIIERERTLISHKSIRETEKYIGKMNDNKMKSVSTEYLIKFFRKKLNTQ